MNIRKMSKIIACGALATTMLGSVAGCDKNKLTIDSYEVDHGSTQFVVNDKFSVEGFKLKLKMSDDSVEEIDITDDMITSSPDMSCSGSKEVKITYDGNEYTFSIYVGGYSNEEMLAKLEQFKKNYEGVKAASTVNTTMSYKFDARFLNNTAQDEQFSDDYEFSKSDISSDRLIDYLYTLLHNQVTMDSLNSDEENIINANDLKVKLDLIKTLETVYNDSTSFDYIRYLMKDHIFPEDDSLYIEDMSENICYNFEINSTTGKRAVTNWVNTYYYKLLDLDTTAVSDAIDSFNSLIQTHSDNNEIKEAISIIHSKVTDADKNVLSTFFKNLAESNIDISIFTSIEDGEFVKDDNEAYNLSKSIILNFSNIIKEIENLGYELTVEEDRNALDVETLDAIKTNLASVRASLVSIESKWNCISDYFTSQIVEEVENHIQLLIDSEVSILPFIASVMDYNKILDTVLRNYFELGDYVTTEVCDTLTNLVSDILNLNVDYDYEEYITTLCEELDISDKTQDFIDEFEANKTLSIASYYMSKVYEEYKTADNYDADTLLYVPNIIEATKYVEQIPVNKFDVDEFRVKLYNVFVGINDSENANDFSNIMEILLSSSEYRENLDNIIREYKSDVIDGITDTFSTLLCLDTAGHNSLKTDIGQMVNEYLADEDIDFEDFAKNCVNIVNRYSDEETKVMVNSLFICSLITYGTNYDLDFNKIFRDVELPSQLESVDYNKVIEKITSQNTYTNSVKIKDVEVQYITNELKQITKQVLIVTLESRMDVEISEFTGEFKINIEMSL